MNLLLKTDGDLEKSMEVGVQKVLFCYFCFWWCFNCWWVGCDRKSYIGQAEIACFCLFRDAKVSSRFLCVTPRVKRFSLDLHRAVKKM